MILVIKDGRVLATYENHQDVRAAYPECEIIQWDASYPLDPQGNNLDPRTEEQKRLAYRDKRRQTYPSLGDQLDMIYWDQINGTTTWREAVAVIKARYLKVQ